MFQITAPTTNSLTASLDSILVFPTMNMDFDYFPNVKIIVNADREVPVHHCVLSARSEFFKNVFSVKDSGSSAAMASSSVAAPRFELKELAKEYDWMRSSLFWGICTAGSSGVCLKAFASAWTTLAHTSLVGRWLISRWRAPSPTPTAGPLVDLVVPERQRATGGGSAAHCAADKD
ncbi:hypothetical protein ACFX15_001588 [Malus domestica]